jgi:hypothetical protein
MIGTKGIYERLRPLIVWLGLTELAWLGYWLLSGGDNSPAFVGIVLVWIVAMLAWLALVILGDLRGFFLQHSNKLSNLVGVAIVVAFAVVMFGLIPPYAKGL